MGGAERVDRPWAALVEWVAADQAEPTSRARRALASLTDAAFVVVPPVVAGSITAAYAPVEAAYAVGGGLLIATSTLVQPLRRRLRSRGLRVAGSEKYTLTAERAAFHRAVALADRISETWPALGSLVDVPEAEQMLADALWEMAGLLSRRQTLTGVLAELSRPEFTASDDLNAQLRATKEALSDLDIDLARREASLRRADEAGRDFIREQDMRQAIKSAEVELSATTMLPDAGTRLADQTRSVLAAYQELIS